MRNRRSVLLFGVMALLVLALAACGGSAKLGTEKNPIVMSFVPSGDTQNIIASGDTLAKMVSEKTGLVVKSNVGTAAIRNMAQSGSSSS